MIYLSVEKVRSFVYSMLLKADVREDVASSVTEGLIQASLRGVDSHGIRLLPHYLEGVKKGRINANPKYSFCKTNLSTGLLDADHTFGHAAGMEAVKRVVDLAKEAGTGHVAIYNSSHFGAAAYYALEIAKHDMIGMSFSNTDALVQTYGGKKPFLGNNPMAIAAPCKEEEPFCLDMATSMVTFNKVRQWREIGQEAPPGTGADLEGNETTNPHDMVMLSPFGGYKGFGLGFAIEMLCSLLTGMPYGPNIPKMFEAPMNQKRFLGHFLIAIKIDAFQPIDLFKKHLSQMMSDIRQEPRKNSQVPIQVAGDPEKKAFLERIQRGIPLSPKEYEMFKKLGTMDRIDIDEY